jgi:pyruvate dehydrogenase kinase 2/3/4
MRPLRFVRRSSTARIEAELALRDYAELARHTRELGPFPLYLSILNHQHFYQNEVLMGYARKEPHPVLLRQLAGYGKTLTKQKIIDSANFVRLELPIRLAMRIRDLQTLPFGVVNNFHLAQIYESYYHLFNAFRKFGRIATLEQNDRFCHTLLALLDDHVFNLPHLMMGALEVSILTDLPRDALDEFMSLMLRLRLSRRVIVEEHLLLTENYRAAPYRKNPPDFIGTIFAPCHAARHFEEVAEVLRQLMGGPEVALEIEGDVDTTFPFMIPHLHYLFGEILRNLYEAMARTHVAYPIKITIVNLPHEVVFRILDQGGGVAHDKLANIWSFGKPAAEARASLDNFHRIPGLQLYHNLKVTPSGSLIVGATAEKRSTLDSLVRRGHQYKFGLGLPMCKVYADYWNGSLLMNSLEGYGSDTCLVLRKLGLYSHTNQLDRA